MPFFLTWCQGFLWLPQGGVLLVLVEQARKNDQARPAREDMSTAEKQCSSTLQAQSPGWPIHAKRFVRIAPFRVMIAWVALVRNKPFCLFSESCGNEVGTVKTSCFFGWHVSRMKVAQILRNAPKFPEFPELLFKVGLKNPQNSHRKSHKLSLQQESSLTSFCRRGGTTLRNDSHETVSHKAPRFAPSLAKATKNEAHGVKIDP